MEEGILLLVYEVGKHGMRVVWNAII